MNEQLKLTKLWTEALSTWYRQMFITAVKQWRPTLKKNKHPVVASDVFVT